MLYSTSHNVSQKIKKGHSLGIIGGKKSVLQFQFYVNASVITTVPGNIESGRV